MLFMTFQSYSLLSVVTAFAMIVHAVQKQEGSFFNTVVYLTSQKINLLVFFNFFVVALFNMAGIMIWIFFDSIRSIESKYLMDKSQKKIFHFLLLTLILRSTFDVYKFLSLAVLFGFWVIHWLVYKRCDYLISRGSRGVKDHLRLLVLYAILIVIDFVIAFAFYERFQTAGEKMNEIYVIIGFEFVRLLLKAIQDNFKYVINIVELYYREQWTEKGFVFNIVSFIFDFTVLLLNIKLFTYILSRQQFPLYLLGEIIDTFVRLGKSIQLFIQSRSLINKLKRLPDVNAPEDLPAGVDNTCIICLEEIKKAKKLPKCGHIFHLNCLRRWLEQNIQCPTCRDKIELDYPLPGERIDDPALRDQQRMQNVARRRAARLARRVEIIAAPPDQQEGTIIIKDEQDTTQPPQVVEPQTPFTQSDEYTRREMRLNKFKYKMMSHNDLLEADRILDEIAKDLIEASNITNKDGISNLKEDLFEMNNEEEKKEDGMFKDIFDFNEEDVLDQIDNNRTDKLTEGVIDSDSGQEDFNVKVEDKIPPFVNKINNNSFDNPYASNEKQPRTNRTQFVPKQTNPYNLKFGSVPFGLPCIASTRRTLDMTLKNKQIEMINDKLCRVMRQPAEYVKYEDHQ